MNKRFLTASLAVIAALCGALTGIACADPSPQPNPPPQICVNNQCANTTQGTSPVATGQIKWNPGHYMASYNVVYGGQKSISNLQYEMDDLNNRDAILGYRMFITWGALEPTQGNYDFSIIDAVLARLKTAYNKPKRLVVELWLYSHSKYSNGDVSVFPQYIQTNPMYGASPVTGTYGWWGANANGASTGMYSPALYNPPVMDRLIALTQALGKHLDGEAYMEGFFIQEDSTIAQMAANLGSVDPNYSDAGWLAQLQRLMTASTGAFPHTNVILANSYFLRPPSGIAMEQWMADNRLAAGAADTLGQSAITTYGTGIIGDGLQTYLGVAQFGGIDLRPKMAAMMDIQGPDLYTTYFAKHGGPYTPLDIINAMNQTYKATHAFWTRLTGSQVPAAAQWPALAATAAANPLIRTAYPQNYQ